MYARLESGYKSTDREAIEKILNSHHLRKLQITKSEKVSVFLMAETATERQILDVLSLLADKSFNLREILAELLRVQNIQKGYRVFLEYAL